MKKLSSIFLAVSMFLYGGLALSPALALADDHESNHNSDNHGSVVSAVAHSHSESEGENHGSIVSAVARDNHGHEDENGQENQNENENENENEHNNGGQNQFFQFSNISTTPGATSTVINWTTSANTLGTIFFGTNSSSLTSSVSESGSLSLSHQVTLTGLTPNTVYFYLIRATDSGSNSATSSIFSFTTSSSTSSDTTPPNILFATNIGSGASTTSLIWVTNEASDSKIWIGTTSPVSTTTAPVASSGTLSFFHQLSIPGLATSTLYFYTISSTDSSGNTTFYSNSFTTPSTL